MGQLLEGILSSQGFEPHGYCFLWTQSLLWIYIVSDSLITLSYYSIPIALIYFVHKRRDLAFNWPDFPAYFIHYIGAEAAD